MERFSRILDPVFTGIKWLTVFLLTVMVVMESYEISMRTFTGDTPVWAKEITLLSMVWLGCLGASVLHRERGHITLELVVDKFFRKARPQILAMVDLLILIFAVFIFYGGSVVVIELMGQARPGTNLPVGASYLPLAVTGVLLALTSIEHLLKRSGEEGQDAA